MRLQVNELRVFQNEVQAYVITEKLWKVWKALAKQQKTNSQVLAKQTRSIFDFMQNFTLGSPVESIECSAIICIFQVILYILECRVLFL